MDVVFCFGVLSLGSLVPSTDAAVIEISIAVCAWLRRDSAKAPEPGAV